LCGARGRAKKFNLEIDLDRQWIVSHLTPMRCEVTGVDFVLQVDRTVAHTPFRPSIDRIDNKMGHTKGNCRIVAVIYNKAKSDGSDQDVLRMAEALVAKKASNG